MKKTLFVICLLISGMLFIPSAEAGLVTFNYSGDFFSQTGFASPVVINFTGATVSGSYTFDDTTGGAGNYVNALTSLSGTVAYAGGSFFFYGAVDGNILIENDIAQGLNFRDRYDVFAGGGDGVTDTLSNYTLQAFRLTMVSLGNPNNDITSTALTSVPPPLFGNKTITLNFNAPGVINGINFTLTSLTPSSVPEPSTLLLLGSGLVGLVGYGRRRMKK